MPAIAMRAGRAEGKGEGGGSEEGERLVGCGYAVYGEGYSDIAAIVWEMVDARWVPPRLSIYRSEGQF